MVQMQRPAEQESIEELIRFVSHAGEEEGFSPMRVREMELAVEEALINILTYAYPKKSGDIQIRCDRESEELVFEIVDHGLAFDPLSLPVPDLLAELAVRRVGGLGVFFVREMTDRAEYRREGGANILTLVFGKSSPSEGT